MYELHAILCHQGSLHQGHYFCFIKNRHQSAKNGDNGKNDERMEVDSIDADLLFDDDSWVKYNDEIVTPAFHHVAMTTGQGGYQSSYTLEYDSKALLSDGEEEEEGVSEKEDH